MIDARTRWQCAYRLYRSSRHTAGYPYNTSVLEALDTLVGWKISWCCALKHKSDQLTVPVSTRLRLLRNCGIHHSRSIRQRWVTPTGSTKKNHTLSMRLHQKPGTAERM